MKFTKIHPLIKPDQQDYAQKRFLQLLLDLGVRDTNFNVGSCLGGNNFALVVLMSCEHHLIPGDQILVSGNVFEWGTDLFIRSHSLKDLRAKVDLAVLSVEEQFKLRALMFEAAIDRHNILEGLKKNQTQFPNLSSHLSGGLMKFDLSFSPLDHLIQAYSIVQDLAEDLDKVGMNSTMISGVGKFICQCELEIGLLSVRRFICLDRIMKFKLDLHPDWQWLFDQVHKGIQFELGRL